ncbi:MAG: hypothetical protein P8K07_17560 [Candidatus Binatia bacterium]|nr:hypothetical protein [Candidatus Binatia bacterium]
MQRAGAAFVRLQTPADFEGTPRIKAPFYLLAAVMLLAASCGDSNNKGPERLFVETSSGATLTDSTLTLTGISPQTGWFTDRPYREAGQIPAEEHRQAIGTVRCGRGVVRPHCLQDPGAKNGSSATWFGRDADLRESLDSPMTPSRVW